MFHSYIVLIFWLFFYPILIDLCFDAVIPKLRAGPLVGHKSIACGANY